jgi:hypothetical protein
MVRKKRKKPSFQRQKLGFVCHSILFPIHETYFHLVSVVLCGEMSFLLSAFRVLLSV